MAVDDVPVRSADVDFQVLFARHAPLAVRTDVPGEASVAVAVTEVRDHVLDRQSQEVTVLEYAFDVLAFLYRGLPDRFVLFGVPAPTNVLPLRYVAPGTVMTISSVLVIKIAVIP